MLQELLRPTRASLKNWPRGGATLPNAKRSFFPSTNVSLPRNVSSKRFGANVHPMLLSVLKMKYKSKEKVITDTSKTSDRQQTQTQSPETSNREQTQSPAAFQLVFSTPERPQTAPADPRQTGGVSSTRRREFGQAVERGRRRIDMGARTDRAGQNFAAASTAGYLQRDKDYVDNAEQQDQTAFRKEMDDLAAELAVVDKLSNGRDKTRQIADIAMRKRNITSYYDDKAARKSKTTDKGDDSEPTKEVRTEQQRRIQAIADDEANENAATAAKEKEQMSAAAAAELEQRDIELQRTKDAEKEMELQGLEKDIEDGEAAEAVAAAKTKAESERAAAAKAKADSERAAAAKAKAESKRVAAAKAKADSERAAQAKVAAQAKAAAEQAAATQQAAARQNKLLQREQKAAAAKAEKQQMFAAAK